MKESPISPDLKVRDQRTTPVTVPERVVKTAQQAGQGFDIMAARAQGIARNMLGIPAPSVPQPFRGGAPSPQVSPEWARGVAIAAARARASLAAAGKLPL